MIRFRKCFLKQPRHSLLFFLVIVVFLAQRNCFGSPDTSFPWRGINISYHRPWSEKDFLKLNQWGVNVIRLVLHSDPTKKQYGGFFLDDLSGMNADAFIGVDEIIACAERHAIKVILELHSFPGQSSGDLWRSTERWVLFEKFWRYETGR